MKNKDGLHFRNLKESEIECRPQIVKQKGCSILLYKNARCDMNILDETVGILNWERRHDTVGGNLFCAVRIYDNKKQSWVSKSDVGTESMSDKEKGQASDSFKRACFNWGIGRELYTAPFIWVKLKNSEVYQRKGKWRLKARAKFHVKYILYKRGHITSVVIADSKNKERYRWTK